MAVYINGISAISPQNTFESNNLPNNLDNDECQYLQIKTPEYKKYIPAVALRRMSKSLRIGVIAGLNAMQNAGLDKVDAITTGTGLGNIEDTEKFLNKILDNNEQFLVPTSFMQSTPNVVGGQIALIKGIKTHNITYVSDNVAFESALIDVLMKFELNEISSALVGGFDVITDENYETKQNLNLWRKNKTKPLNLFDYSESGCLLGESASFFTLQNIKTEKTYAQIIDSEIIFNKNKELSSELISFLNKNKLSVNDVDLIIGGYNGDYEYDKKIDKFINQLFPNSTIATYKNICGEHFTASAFALWLASIILKNEDIPKNIIRKQSDNKEIKNILIWQNSFFKENLSGFILISKYG